MNKKIFYAQIAGKINGIFYDVGASVDIEAAEAKPLIDLGVIAGDGNEIEAVTSEEFAETVNVLSAEIARLTDENKVLVESAEFVSSSQKKRIEELSKLLSDATEKVVSLESEITKQKELISELSIEINEVKRVNGILLTENSGYKSALAEKEKQTQTEQTPANTEVKETAPAETKEPVQKSKKK